MITNNIKAFGTNATQYYTDSDLTIGSTGLTQMENGAVYNTLLNQIAYNTFLKVCSGAVYGLATMLTANEPSLTLTLGSDTTPTQWANAMGQIATMSVLADYAKTTDLDDYAKADEVVTSVNGSQGAVQVHLYEHRVHLSNANPYDYLYISVLSGSNAPISSIYSLATLVGATSGDLGYTYHTTAVQSRSSVPKSVDCSIYWYSGSFRVAVYDGTSTATNYTAIDEDNVRQIF